MNYKEEIMNKIYTVAGVISILIAISVLIYIIIVAI
jgi:hypothetical protein